MNKIKCEVKLSEKDIERCLFNLRNGNNVVMFIHDETKRKNYDDVQLRIIPFGEMKENHNVEEDTLLFEIILFELKYELISTKSGEKYIYGPGKRFRYGFKVSDNAVLLRKKDSILIVVNEDNSETEIEINR